VRLLISLYSSALEKSKNIGDYFGGIITRLKNERATMNRIIIFFKNILGDNYTELLVPLILLSTEWLILIVPMKQLKLKL